MLGRSGIDFPGLGAGLAILRDNNILLYRRLRAPEAGYWNIVGGKIDHMEPADIAAIREAEEETGLAIGEIEHLLTTEQILPDDRQHWVSLIYVSRNSRGEPQLTEPDKLSAFGWYDLDDLPRPLSVFATAAVAALRKS